MRYLPHTPEDIAAMLDVVGEEYLDDLFATIPDDCRRTRDLDLPEPMTEWDLGRHVSDLARNMAVEPKRNIFLGAGKYEHYIPHAVSYLLGRSEFSTSYTPYQPEISQGTLQAIYEYQTLVSRFLGMEAANASLYDGASALAEALLMAIRVTRRKKVALSRVINPFYRQVVQTYFRATDYELIEFPYLETGRTDISEISKLDDLAAVAVQSPNFFGCMEDLVQVGEHCRQAGALFVVAFSEPLAYGLFKNPGSQGADIVCGEGQSFGIPVSFGGPGLGMFASKMKYIRSVPGRLVGETVDIDGKRGFVLTLATREQHIRREKATSNICTNNSLCALTVTMYMSCLGGTGIRELARLNYDKCEYLKNELEKSGFKTSFNSPTFNEFVVKLPSDFGASSKRPADKGIVPGLDLTPYYPELADHYLLCVTETKTREDMDALVREIAS
jgi:glycine dehydrogenase subunit 1